MYIPESITFFNCQCHDFWLRVAIIIDVPIKKDCTNRENCGIQLLDGDLEHSLMKEKNRFSYVFLPIFMFCHSRLRFRNLTYANSCMFLSCITASSLLICSWHEMSLSQFAQQIYSIFSKSLLFTSISHVQESFKLNKVNHG